MPGVCNGTSDVQVRRCPTIRLACQPRQLGLGCALRCEAFNNGTSDVQVRRCHTIRLACLQAGDSSLPSVPLLAQSVGYGLDLVLERWQSFLFQIFV